MTYFGIPTTSFLSSTCCWYCMFLGKCFCGTNASVSYQDLVLSVQGLAKLQFQTVSFCHSYLACLHMNWDENCQAISDVLNTRPVGRIRPMIGPELSRRAIPVTARDWPMPPRPSPTLAMPTQLAVMTRPHPLQPPKEKQNPDTACHGIKFDTPGLSFPCLLHF